MTSSPLVDPASVAITLAFLVSLVARELCAVGSPRMQAVARVLSVSIVPLAIAFAVVVAYRVLALLAITD
ncbi:MAG: hypothetical protein J2P17_34985 [Mycobacterium sp.]|nr:hypothetical protein [Mycobacterium sp.]